MDVLALRRRGSSTAKTPLLLVSPKSESPSPQKSLLSPLSRVPCYIITSLVNGGKGRKK